MPQSQLGTLLLGSRMVFRLQSISKGLLKFRAVGKRKLAEVSTRHALSGLDGLSATIC